jgi:hypothetical protein
MPTEAEPDIQAGRGAVDREIEKRRGPTFNPGGQMSGLHEGGAPSAAERNPTTVGIRTARELVGFQDAKPPMIRIPPPLPLACWAWKPASRKEPGRQKVFALPLHRLQAQGAPASPGSDPCADQTRSAPDACCMNQWAAFVPRGARYVGLEN